MQRQLCRWATPTRWGRGEPFLLDADPTRAVHLEWNGDPCQPLVTDEVLAGLREQAPEVTVQLEQAARDSPAVEAPTCLPVLIGVAGGPEDVEVEVVAGQELFAEESPRMLTTCEWRRTQLDRLARRPTGPPPR